jgi:hypothetical protein
MIERVWKVPALLKFKPHMTTADVASACKPLVPAEYTS